MARIFIALGSNIRPAENIIKAVRKISEKVRINSISTVYCTEAEERPEQPLYFNCVLEAESDSSPEEIKFHILRLIENQMDRKRSDDKDAPRTIDLDLIAYDDLVLSSDRLTLPDPLIAVRPFLAIPLAELAPDFVVSDRNLPIKEIASKMATGRMKGLYQYTDVLRMEICHGH